ncbi:uncharacterized protein LOC144434078 [Glandiceps talaboti]
MPVVTTLPSESAAMETNITSISTVSPDQYTNLDFQDLEELLKSWIFLTHQDYCQGDSVVEPPKVYTIRKELKEDRVVIKLINEENDVNYFAVYQGLEGRHNFALRSGQKTNIPLKYIPKDTVVMVEIFALRRCSWQVYWSSPIYLEIVVNQDDKVSVVTPPVPTPCEVPRPSMALEGKTSENSITLSMKAEPSIDNYLITMESKILVQQSIISNGPPGSAINGMTIGDLSPASMYRVTILGQTQCLGKAFHGAPIFFTAKTIGTHVETVETQTEVVPGVTLAAGQLEIHY